MALRTGQGQSFGGVFNSGNLTLRNSTVIDNNGLGDAGLGSVVTLNGSMVSGGVYGNRINSGLLQPSISANDIVIVA